MMERRTFLALIPGSLLAAPRPAEAQAGKVHRIALIASGRRHRLPSTKASSSSACENLAGSTGGTSSPNDAHTVIETTRSLTSLPN